MPREREQYNFRPSGRQRKRLEEYRDEHDATKAEAVRHFAEMGIAAEEWGDPVEPRSYDRLETMAIQAAVMALAIVMMSTDAVGLIPQRAALWTALGLLAVAFWLYVASAKDLVGHLRVHAADLRARLGRRPGDHEDDEAQPTDD